MVDKFATFRDHFLSLYQSAVADLARQIQTQVGTSGALEVLDTGNRQRILITAAERVAEIRSANQTEVGDHGTNLEAMSPLQTAQVCASLAFRLLEARVRGDQITAQRLQDQLQGSTCDPG